ncbi:ribosomal protein L11, N-terminal domain-containing protein [Globomyces pollinis-pini]|nr:ribosomal protein L11, N-terminal domain-containing protein [Globomyces pollinis-pini]
MSKPLAVKQTIKLIIPAGKAAPAPPVGPALGQKGVKAIDFCKQFNDQTKKFVQGIPVTTRITVNPDKSFSFFIRTPPTSWLIKQTLGIEKGSGKPGSVNVGELSLKHVYAIAQVKQNDPALQSVKLESICRRVMGTARNMGVNIVA